VVCDFSREKSSRYIHTSKLFSNTIGSVLGSKKVHLIETTFSDLLFSRRSVAEVLLLWRERPKDVLKIGLETCFESQSLLWQQMMYEPGY